MLNHFDLLASIYDKVIGKPDHAHLRELLLLPVRGSLLDAGGGTGRVSAQLRADVDRIIISDLSLPMLEQARIKGGLSAIQTHAEALPFPDASFERILVVDALHHFRDQQQAMRELVRVLKRGGRLVIEEPDIARFPVKCVAVAEKIMLMRSHFLSPAEIQSFYRAAGYNAGIESNGGFSTWIIITKDEIERFEK